MTLCSAVNLVLTTVIYNGLFKIDLGLGKAKVVKFDLSDIYHTVFKM